LRYLQLRFDFYSISIRLRFDSHSTAIRQNEGVFDDHMFRP